MEPESRLFLMLDQEAVNVSRFYPNEAVSIVSEACSNGISGNLDGGQDGQERRPRHCIKDQRRYCTTRDARHGALRGTEPKPSCL
jgi:hypothetical protein